MNSGYFRFFCKGMHGMALCKGGGGTDIAEADYP